MSSEIHTKDNRVNNKKIEIIKNTKIYNKKINNNNDKDDNKANNEKIRNSCGREKLLGQHPLCEQAIDSTPVSKNEREKEKLSRYSSRLYKKIFATHDIHVVHRGFPRTKDSA